MADGSDHSPAEPRASVLLVDDQPANLLALEAVLADLGQPLVRASSGEEALRLLLQDDFAVVLLDLRLPGLDGFETARQLRSRARSRHTPIIFLTAYEDPAFPAEKAYTLGAVDYLIKPFVPVILRAKVAFFVELFQKGRQVERQAALLQQARQEQAERRALVQYVVAGLLAEADDPAAAMPAILRAVGTALGWDVAALWAVDRDAGALLCESFWQTPASASREFEAASRGLPLGPGEGLPGSVCASGESIWIEDIARDPHFPRAREALAAGLHAACALPLRIALETIGVLEFFSKAARPRDDETLRALAAVGSQLGQSLERRRAAEEVRRSEARKAAVVEAALDAIVTIDAQGRVAEWNPAAEALFGRPRADVLGRDLADLVIPPGLRARHRGGLAHYLTTGEGPILRRRLELTALRADGSEFPVELAITPIAAGGPPLFTAYLRDLTAAREAEQTLRASQERLRLVAENVQDYALFFLDPQGNVISWNAGAERILGYRADEILGQPINRFFTPEDIAAGRPAHELHQAAATGRDSNDCWLVRKDGSRFWASGVTTALRDGWLHGFVKILRDLTERKQFEEELQHHAEELAERDRRKDEWIAMLAHELRNPLAPLLTTLYVLRQGSANQTPPAESLDRMERQLRHLGRLVDDLLDASRLLRGQVPVRPVRLDLARLARTAAGDRREALASAGVMLAVVAPETPVWIQGDATRLTQVLHNLLENALKFTPAGGRVEVRVAAAGDSRQAVLAVADTGQGIAAEMLAHVFEPFAQGAQGLDRPRGGLGLGLALVKGLVELHGGVVWAASAGPGRGAVFEIRLPLEPEPAALSNGPRRPALVAGRSKIMVIEDNKDAADSLRMLLEILGHQARVAYTGPDGVQAAAAWRPDVVISDVGLPGYDGYEVARRLRQTPGLEGVLLIALTGYGSEDDRRRGQEAGFDHYLVKPANPDDLRQLLTRVA